MKINLLILFIISSIFINCQKDKQEIIVFAAISTTEIITNLAKEFEEKHGKKFKLNFASTGTLAKQIESGAKVDIFISASKDWMEYLEKKNLILKQNEFLKNKIALISPLNSSLNKIKFNKEFNLSKAFIGKIAIGDPDHVPAGKYSLEALKFFGWDKNLKTRILPTLSVRDALRVVELGEVDLGIVYLSDAKISKKVKVLGVFPEDSHPPIIYYAGLLKGASSQSEYFYSSILNYKQNE